MNRTSERERAASALAGTYFPKAGDVGLVQMDRTAGVRSRKVHVARVSNTGKTVWFSDPLVGRGVAWRRWSDNGLWLAPVPRSALPGSPRVQLPAPKR